MPLLENQILFLLSRGVLTARDTIDGLYALTYQGHLICKMTGDVNIMTPPNLSMFQTLKYKPLCLEDALDMVKQQLNDFPWYTPVRQKLTRLFLEELRDRLEDPEKHNLSITIHMLKALQEKWSVLSQTRRELFENVLSSDGQTLLPGLARCLVLSENGTTIIQTVTSSLYTPSKFLARTEEKVYILKELPIVNED